MKPLTRLPPGKVTCGARTVGALGAMVGILMATVDPYGFLGRLAVLAAALKARAVGAPLVPGLRMRSPDPALMRSRLAFILAYNPGFITYTPNVFLQPCHVHLSILNF